MLRLPPVPDFTQLRHQAKALLRAHERKEATVFGVSVREVLRNLRQFASADDAAIWSKPLALHEAQYQAFELEAGRGNTKQIRMLPSRYRAHYMWLDRKEVYTVNVTCPDGLGASIPALAFDLRLPTTKADH